MSAPAPLTICTVSYHHKRHLLLNMALTAQRNPDTDIASRQKRSRDAEVEFAAASLEREYGITADDRLLAHE